MQAGYEYLCIYIIKRQPSSVLDPLVALPTEEVGIPVVTVSGLRHGAGKSTRPERNHQALDKFLRPFEVALDDEPASKTYGAIRSALEKTGRPIGPMDLLIAAHALSLEVRLVTNNAKDFERVDGMKTDNWA